ncbi:MAG: Coenzyme F420 hydrogenase/dehydrogenase, beta subunit C-terminal domain [Bacteroides sp.]|nr:Coenzyme F420 hydrogenase/dehydrogenase, beta subunit C-terminal domain [Bacteroides sp.]MCM1413232.1 Coenzyme F420 hydrogenase/dehydrogenase, beta subunit C-terminal domain [Bacteroides sp.]MCM1471458.1 Coenzyme F420 hydrogenase/dehydrogenase, beta subunit C-terminal domain [Bacteroides sp.]
MSVAGKKHKDCCGCNACAEICPKACIEMRQDRKGFLYAHVDTAKCIECGLCNRVCPFENPPLNAERPTAAYAGRVRDKAIYTRSTSGGTAYELGMWALRRGGAVYGCTADGLDIRHIRVDSPDELHRLQGSKYVQSDVRCVFQHVAEDLKAGLAVTFIGTPCQTAALKNYLRKPYELLLLVDLICHGVPSQKMLRDHVASIAKGRSVSRIKFRENPESYFTIWDDKGEKIYTVDFWANTYSNMYLKGFMSGFIYRPSCHECPFPQPVRASDITVGDFWGLNDQAMVDSWTNGISVILPSTPKGVQAVAEIAPGMELVERTVDEAVAGNEQLRQPTPHTYRDIIFSALYPMLSLNRAVWLAVLPHRAYRTLRRKLRPLKRLFKRQR